MSVRGVDESEIVKKVKHSHKSAAAELRCGRPYMSSRKYWFIDGTLVARRQFYGLRLKSSKALDVKSCSNVTSKDSTSKAQLRQFVPNFCKKVRNLSLLAKSLDATPVLVFDQLGVAGSTSWRQELLKGYKQRPPSETLDQDENTRAYESRMRLLLTQFLPVSGIACYVAPAGLEADDALAALACKAVGTATEQRLDREFLEQGFNGVSLLRKQKQEPKKRVRIGSTGAFMAEKNTCTESACVAETVARSKADVTVVSSDKDYLQLMAHGIQVVDPFSMKFFTEKEIHKKFGVTPNRIADFLAINGDAADCVPGVNGLGAKRVGKLFESEALKKENLETILNMEVEELAKKTELEEKYCRDLIFSRERVLVNYACVRLPPPLFLNRCADAIRQLHFFNLEKAVTTAERNFCFQKMMSFGTAHAEGKHEKLLDKWEGLQKNTGPGDKKRSFWSRADSLRFSLCQQLEHVYKADKIYRDFLLSVGRAPLRGQQRFSSLEARIEEAPRKKGAPFLFRDNISEVRRVVGAVEGSSEPHHEAAANSLMETAVCNEALESELDEVFGRPDSIIARTRIQKTNF